MMGRTDRMTADEYTQYETLNVRLSNKMRAAMREQWAHEFGESRRLEDGAVRVYMTLTRGMLDDLRDLASRGELDGGQRNEFLMGGSGMHAIEEFTHKLYELSPSRQASLMARWLAEYPSMLVGSGGVDDIASMRFYVRQGMLEDVRRASEDQ